MVWGLVLVIGTFFKCVFIFIFYFFSFLSSFLSFSLFPFFFFFGGVVVWGENGEEGDVKECVEGEMCWMDGCG